MDLNEIKKYTSTAFMYSGGANFETHIAKQKNSVFRFYPSLTFALYTFMYLALTLISYYTGMRL
jgi:hypothetical protein